MGATNYLFESHEHGAELRRLQVQEDVWDPHSRGRLLALGLAEGHRCLEVGVGAGSMCRWMAEQVGPGGRVVGIDTDDRFFALQDGTGVELRVADIRTVELEPESFDVIHVRLLFEHLSDRSEVLRRLVAALVPGGWLLAADNDLSFPGQIADADVARQWEVVLRTTVDLLARNGSDLTFGPHLADLLEAGGLEDVDSEGTFPQARPGSRGLDMMFENLDTLDRLKVETGLSPSGVEELRRAISTPGVVRRGYVLMWAWGRRPLAASGTSG